MDNLNLAIPSQGNQHLQRSIKMANAYLNHNAFGLILTHFDINPQIVASQTPSIVIEQLAHDGSCWAATNPETGLGNLTILISDYFNRRIEQANLLETDIEYRILIFFQAVCILHEFGHLLNRWAGIKDSPEQHLFEAGSFVEVRLFGYRINLAYLENNNQAEVKAVAIAVFIQPEIVRISSNWIDRLYLHLIHREEMPHPYTMDLMQVDFANPLDFEKTPGLKMKGINDTPKAQVVRPSTNTPISTLTLANTCNRAEKQLREQEAFQTQN